MATKDSLVLGKVVSVGSSDCIKGWIAMNTTIKSQSPARFVLHSAMWFAPYESMQLHQRPFHADFAKWSAFFLLCLIMPSNFKSARAL